MQHKVGSETKKDHYIKIHLGFSLRFTTASTQLEKLYASQNSSNTYVTYLLRNNNVVLFLNVQK